MFQWWDLFPAIIASFKIHVGLELSREVTKGTSRKAFAFLTKRDISSWQPLPPSCPGVSRYWWPGAAILTTLGKETNPLKTVDQENRSTYWLYCGVTNPKAAATTTSRLFTWKKKPLFVKSLLDSLFFVNFGWRPEKSIMYSRTFAAVRFQDK